MVKILNIIRIDNYTVIYYRNRVIYFGKIYLQEKENYLLEKSYLILFFTF